MNWSACFHGSLSLVRFFFLFHSIVPQLKLMMVLYLSISGCLFPLGAWLFGLLDHFSLILSCLCSTSIILSVYVSFLIIQQTFLILNSQTWYERQQNIHLYNTRRSFQSNFKTVLGKNWSIIFFSPLISSQPIGDAMSFDMNEAQRIGTKHT